jgi:hypothetical protein
VERSEQGAHLTAQSLDLSLSLSGSVPWPVCHGRCMHWTEWTCTPWGAARLRRSPRRVHRSPRRVHRSPRRVHRSPRRCPDARPPPPGAAPDERGNQHAISTWRAPSAARHGAPSAACTASRLMLPRRRPSCRGASRSRRRMHRSRQRIHRSRRRSTRSRRGAPPAHAAAIPLMNSSNSREPSVTPRERRARFAVSVSWCPCAS